MSSESVQSSDIAKGVIAGPLKLVTICTSDLSAITSFYKEELGLSINGPHELEAEEKEKLSAFWDIPLTLGFDVYSLSTGEGITELHTRIIHIHEETPYFRGSYDVKELGPYMIDMTMNHEQKIVKAPGKYLCRTVEASYGETNLELGNRVQDKPLFATFMSDKIEEELLLFTHVLGLSLQPDLTNNASNGSNGKDSIHNYKISARDGEGYRLMLVGYEEDDCIDLEEAPRLPNQGMVMWSFETRDIGEVLARAHAKEVKIYRTPRKLSTPLLGEVIALTLLSSTGYIIEVYSRL